MIIKNTCAVSYFHSGLKTKNKLITEIKKRKRKKGTKEKDANHLISGTVRICTE